GYLAHHSHTERLVWRALRAELWRYRHRTQHSLVQHLRQSALGRLYRMCRALGARWMSLPLVRHLRWLGPRRLRPLGKGQQRGTPIVRRYWAQFLQQHRHDIQGDALEIGTTATIRQYGGGAMTRADAIDLEAHSPEITIVADLSRA